MLGPDLLIAPSPYPEAPDAYAVEFPSSDWYDYWTGVKVTPPPAAAIIAAGCKPPATLRPGAA